MRKKQDWPKVIEEWTASGLSKLAFCKSKNITYQSFLMHWKRAGEQDSGGFRQLNVVNPDSSDRIDFHFPDGRCVSFPRETPKDLIRFLVSL